jgi:hypothetical protein
MDSGWNCTPSSGVAVPASSRWRTPMISPSSLRDVISSTAGQVASSMTSEW